MTDESLTEMSLMAFLDHCLAIDLKRHPHAPADSSVFLGAIKDKLQEVIKEIEQFKEHYRLASNRPEEGLVYMREHHGRELAYAHILSLLQGKRE